MRKEIQNRMFWGARGEKILWNEPVFIGPETTVLERAGPLNQGAGPLKIKGAAQTIKGATPSERWGFLSFCGEGFSGSFLPFLVKYLNSYIYNELTIFF